MNHSEYDTEQKKPSKGEFNYAAAIQICKNIYNDSTPFETLNKPTHSEMVFRQKEMDTSDIQEVYRFPNGTVIGLLPPNKNWKAIIPSYNKEMIDKIKIQMDQKCRFEYLCLVRQLDFRGKERELKYLHDLLILRIHCTIIESFRAGMCGELVSYATLQLLSNSALLGNDFNLEVMQLTSEYVDPVGEQYGHIIGVIDRELNSNLNDPTSWGEAAVIYDPWNKGKCFRAQEISKYSYYAYGNWSYKIAYSFRPLLLNNISNEIFRRKFNYLTHYILTTPLSAESNGYIVDALKKFSLNAFQCFY